jgi:hypothetical protein
LSQTLSKHGQVHEGPDKGDDKGCDKVLSMVAFRTILGRLEIRAALIADASARPE